MTPLPLLLLTFKTFSREFCLSHREEAPGFCSCHLDSDCACASFRDPVFFLITWAFFVLLLEDLAVLLRAEFVIFDKLFNLDGVRRSEREYWHCFSLGLSLPLSQVQWRRPEWGADWCMLWAFETQRKNIVSWIPFPGVPLTQADPELGLVSRASVWSVECPRNETDSSAAVHFLSFRKSHQNLSRSSLNPSFPYWQVLSNNIH